MIVAKAVVFLILQTGVTALPMMSERFPCSRFLSMFRGAPEAHSAVLWDTFGKDKRCIRKFLALSAKMPVSLEIHPTCGPCRRNRNYPLQPVPANSDVLKRIGGFIERHRDPRRTFLVSLELEDQFGNKEADDVYARVSKRINARIVRNSIYRVSGPADLIELHGEAAACPAGGNYIADLDGSDLDWPDVRKWLKRNENCRYRRIWRPEWQGIGREFTAPSKRDFNISRRDVREVRKLLREYE